MKTSILVGRRAALRAGAALSITATLLLSGCGGGGNDTFGDRVGVANPRIRFVHAVPGGATVALYRGANTGPESYAQAVGYKYGSAYSTMDTDTVTFSLRVAGASTELAQARFNPDRGHQYTLVALPSASAPSGFTLSVIDDPYNNKSVASDNARLRVLNASARLAPVDVYLTQRGADLNGRSPQWARVGTGESQPPSGADAVTLEGGDYQLRVTPAGSKTVLFSTDVSVPRNADWLLLAVPDDAQPNVPDRLRVLRVSGNDDGPAVQEWTSQP